MSDRGNASITIGGPVPPELVDELCQTIREEGLCRDWADPFNPETAEDLLGALSIDEHLSLSDNQATGDCFDRLEDFLAAYNIPFNRHTDPNNYWDGEIVMFRPGMKKPRYFHATESGHISVTSDGVAEVIKLLEQGLPNTAEQRLKELAGYGTDLPPFTIGPQPPVPDEYRPSLHTLTPQNPTTHERTRRIEIHGSHDSPLPEDA